MRVSVIIPVRNGAALVGDAVASVLSQIDPGDQVLVIDDASTDGTNETLSAYSGRIEVLRGLGRGPSAARNLGLGVACGELVAFLDHDDLWPQDRLKHLKDALAGAPDTMAAAQGRVRIDSVDGEIPRAYAAMNGAYLDWQVMTMLCPIALVRDVGGYAEDMLYGEDIDLGFRLLEAGMRVRRVEATTWIHRRHAGNASNAAEVARRGQAEALRRRLQRLRRVS